MFGRLAGLVAGAMSVVAAAHFALAESPETPRSVVLAALVAVERDSVDEVSSRWQKRIVRSPDDRLALLGLATLARLTYDYDFATQRYTKLSGGDVRDGIMTYALLGLAWQADTRGQITQADTLFVRARLSAREQHDTLAEAEAMLGWAFERGPIDGALVSALIIDSAAKMIPDSATDLLAEYWIRRAVLSAVLSKQSVAKESKRGRQFARLAGIRRLEAKAIGAEALNHLLHGNVEISLAIYDTVAAALREARDFSSLAEILYRQGDANRSRGDLGAFKQFALQAAEEAKRSRNDIVSRSVLLGLGALSLLVHDYSAADQYLSRAVERQKAAGVIAELMLSRAHRAKLYFAIGDIDKARAETRAVIDYHRSTGDGSYEFTSLRDLIAIELRAKRIDEAQRVLSEAEQLARQLKVTAWNRELSEDRGAVALARGDLKAAAREYAAALSLLDTTQHVARHGIRARMAEIAALRGDLATAERELLHADLELDRWRAGLNDRELRTLAFQASATEQSIRGQSVATTIAALAKGGRTVSALQLAERRRARELTDRVSQARALVETAPNERDGDGLGEEPRVVSTDHLTSPDALLVAIPDTRTALVEYVTGTLDAPTTVFVVTRNIDGTPNVRAAVLPSADSLVPAIERFVGLIEAGEDPTVLASSLGATLLNPVVEMLRMQESAGNGNPAKAPSNVNTVYSDLASGTLASNVSPSLSTDTTATVVSRLVIVPDGPLHIVPFDALRLANGSFLVESFITSLAPSNAVIAALRKRKLSRDSARAKRPMRMLVFGDPTFQDGSSSRHQTSSRTPPPNTSAISNSQTLSHDEASRFDPLAYDVDTVPVFEPLPRLAGSAEEARLIARYADSTTVRLRSAASAAYLKSAPLREFRVLHFATHALVNRGTAARTALALAPTDGESGFVSPGELAALSLEADLVVLSACQTAGGVVIDGEGVQGLTSSFLEAGAQSVVASQWRIGDRSTVQVVGDFYDALARGLPVAEALRTAKLRALERGMPARDWAAFTVIGDPSIQIPLTLPVAGPTSSRLVAFGAIGLVLIAGIGYGVARRRRHNR